MAEWRLVPAEPKYWQPINNGFNASNGKFMCSGCGAQYPLAPCINCGSPQSQLGQAMGLPGVFCEGCQTGSYSWICLSCKAVHKTMLAFYYDIQAVQVRKRRFWE